MHTSVDFVAEPHEGQNTYLLFQSSIAVACAMIPDSYCESLNAPGLISTNVESGISFDFQLSDTSTAHNCFLDSSSPRYTVVNTLSWAGGAIHAKRHPDSITSICFLLNMQDNESIESVIELLL